MSRCADCGYLAIRNPDTHELEETISDIREFGELPTIFPKSGSGVVRLLHTKTPVCFAMAANLAKEIQDGCKFKDAINKDRQCARWSQWKQGYSPKEHDQMLASEIAQRAADRQAADNARMQQRQLVWMVVSAFIQGGATLLAAYFGYLLTHPQSPPASPSPANVVAPAPTTLQK